MTGFFQSIITVVLFLAILGDPRRHPRARPFRDRTPGERPRARIRDRLPAAGQGAAREGRDALHAQLAAHRRLREARGRGRQRCGRPTFLRGAALPITKMVILVGGRRHERLARVRDLHRHRLARVPAHGHPLPRGRQPGSPAPAAGLQPGDAIVAVDGERYQFIAGPPSSMACVAARRDRRPDRRQRRRCDGATSRSPCAPRPPSTRARALSGSRRKRSRGRPTSTVPRPRRPSRRRSRRGPADGRGPGADPAAAWARSSSSVASDPTAPPPVAGPVGIATQIGDVFWNAGRS